MSCTSSWVNQTSHGCLPSWASPVYFHTERHTHLSFCVLLSGRWSEEDGGWERPHPEGVQPLLWPDHRQRQPGQSLRDVTGCRGETAQWAPVGPGELGVLRTSSGVPLTTLTGSQWPTSMCAFLTSKPTTRSRGQLGYRRSHLLNHSANSSSCCS